MGDDGRSPVSRWRVAYHMIKLGERISALEVAAAYLLLVFYARSATFFPLFSLNAIVQVCIFTIVCQIPLYVTGKLAFVDLAWPIGLVTLASNCFFYGVGWLPRRYLATGCLLFHGGRMALGAAYLFFPYTFLQGDLSRYQFAKKRYLREGMPPQWWWLKAQQETLTQCLANCVLLAGPFYVLASDPTPHFRVLELAGFAVWGLGSLYENIADAQKNLFLLSCKRAAESGEAERRAAKSAVLGMAPYDGWRYCLWTWSRHPNYGGELLCWLGFAVAPMGSIAWIAQTEGIATGLVLLMNCWLVVRFFYDCLVHWTGSGPAEQSSVEKRPRYREYQVKTPVLIPFKVPMLSSYQVAGWPLQRKDDAKNE
ncbi:hypothetical protein BC830DRAFT_384538 [Chytriomyces sp. MP71]|nr:hypothetical protein BC830DRAFT_384538 [Chytriomyces sp. MP71]